MTDPSLINRLEAADAGSRELDGAIRAQFFDDFFYCDYETGTSCSDAPDCSKDGCYKPLGIMDERTSLPRDWRDDDRLPAYSTSLDAALALVAEVLPEWAVKIDGPKWTYLDHSKWTAMLKEPRGEPEFHQGSMVPLYPHRTIIGETHKSPAIALILALLRATSQEAGDE